MPIAIPPELTKAWFSKNMPKEKDFNVLKSKVDQIESRVKAIEKGEGATGETKALGEDLKVIETEVKKLSGRKSSKDLDKKLSGYANVGKILLNQIAALAKEDDDNEPKQLKEAKLFLDRLKKALDQRETAVASALTKVKTAKDATAKDQAIKEARAAAAGTGTMTWEVWWKETMRIANPANLPSSPSAPKKQDVEALGKRIAKLIELRPKLQQL